MRMRTDESAVGLSAVHLINAALSEKCRDFWQGRSCVQLHNSPWMEDPMRQKRNEEKNQNEDK